ncbi:cadherin-10-like [Megalops cyprinoides]|uniref:cadherin-10-like n=1 Tax=Megalops cyprinoides TaxID=118141 RepID=UPI001863C1E0|nr:cadherin-10-like [Megalops cyprinoides]XP_036374752.1 cadherin-10-like [Megalops cyprinoides]
MRTYLLLALWMALPQPGHAVVFAQRTTGAMAQGSLGQRGEGGATLRRSKRGWMWNQFYIQEEYMGTDYQYMGKLHSDMDKEDGSVRYVLSGEGAGTLFVIDENSGDLHATKRLDREEKANYTLRAQAVNKRTGQPLEPETEFIVKVQDINDNEPKFAKEVYTASIPEMSDVGTSVIQVTATDADDGMYGNSAKLVYSILQGDPYFSVDPKTGIIRTTLPDMKRESREHYQVVIQAKDMAGQKGGLSGTTTVNITLTDVNNSPPRFPQSTYHFSVPESAEVGAQVGRVKATDDDIGVNAEMAYSVVSGEGQDVFDIVTDSRTQEGVIRVKKPLDFERKKTYTLRVQAENTHLDPRFFRLGPFRDSTTVRISVQDVPEPPVFERPRYALEVKEDARVGTAVGSVSAVDPDVTRSPVRYSIDRVTDLDRLFSVHPGNGSIFTLKSLDREEIAWHNISVIATEFSDPRQTSRVPVYIKVLDVNDNAPTFAAYYETYVCENAKAGQKIQTVSAVDADDPAGGHRFFFNLAPESSVRANFTVRDNRDNTAEILTQRSGFSRLEQSSYLVSVVITDGDYPRQSSTSTLTVRVCACDREGNMELCSAEAVALSAGLSTAALVAILLCVIILLLIVVLFAALRRQRKKEPLIISKEDVRDNVVSYNDEGGGEEDTQAFDIGTLRNPQAVDGNKQRRDIIPDSLLAPPIRRTPAPSRDNADVRDFINQRVQDNDSNPTAPPYDSLATYAYEGNGSVAESLSSLASATSEGDQDYNYLSEWGPRFKKLSDLYGGEDSDRDA